MHTHETEDVENLADRGPPARGKNEAIIHLSMRAISP